MLGEAESCEVVAIISALAVGRHCLKLVNKGPLECIYMAPSAPVTLVTSLRLRLLQYLWEWDDIGLG